MARWSGIASASCTTSPSRCCPSAPILDHLLERLKPATLMIYVSVCYRRTRFRFSLRRRTVLDRIPRDQPLGTGGHRLAGSDAVPSWSSTATSDKARHKLSRFHIGTISTQRLRWRSTRSFPTASSTGPDGRFKALMKSQHFPLNRRRHLPLSAEFRALVRTTRRSTCRRYWAGGMMGLRSACSGHEYWTDVGQRNLEMLSALKCVEVTSMRAEQRR